ncbi:hypothetical protein E4U48_003715 [Claviceps purpurea]|nr:hypothetical protein E4U25_004987 [Claviceps purpurea]KAG6247448.1 hypothetical protein E4U23_003816 [Claviceps purpurea]KAG6270680.1 hypothetical protein E4U48_003715 [Claviceps purpurea]KAG6314627.1 hypothetical protein E4U44_001787 [Claviceps purpurea]
MIDLAAIYFGIFIGVFPLTLVKIVRQSRKIISQAHSRSYQNAYLYMIWIEAIVNFVFAIVTYLYLTEVIPGSTGLYFGTIGLWAIQTQLLSQIIANRVSLIMINKRKARLLKWFLFGMIGCINVGVIVIWPAAYEAKATPTQKRLNDVFEMVDKTFFLLVDFSLNGTFLYLVRFRLISHGLKKYWPLFRFNCVLVVLTTSMDAALLGMLNLPSRYLYEQFAPVVYIVKLHVELTMASMIAKVVRKSVTSSGIRHQPLELPKRASRFRCKKHVQIVEENQRGGMQSSSTGTGPDIDAFGNDVSIQKTETSADIPLAYYTGRGGIMKTTTTTVYTADHVREHGASA